MMYSDAMAIVHHATAISLGRVFTDQVFVWPLVELWIGSQRRFVKQPVAWTIVVRIGHFVDVRILKKLAPGFGIHPGPFDVDDKAVFYVDFGSREMTRVIRRAYNNTIGLGRRRAWIPFLLERRILDDRVGKSPRRLIGEHVKMSLLINAARPALRHIFGELRSQIRSFRIGDVQIIGPANRFDSALFGKSPDIARK